MRSLRFAALAAGLLIAGLGDAAAQDSGPITVFVVRHAEKASADPDPSLNEAGRERASALARVLGDAGITVMFSSEFKRTRETAAPLAAQLGIEPVVLDAGKSDELVARLASLPAGAKALVVSHSNLVPGIVQKLSGHGVAELADSDYDRLYVVTLWAGGRGSTLYLHYGAPSPKGSGAPMRP